MTEFEKQAYASMNSEGRIILWLAKAAELVEFQSAMTEEDVHGLMRVRELLREARPYD